MAQDPIFEGPAESCALPGMADSPGGRCGDKNLNLEAYPAIKLLDFFQGLEEGDAATVKISSQHTEEDNLGMQRLEGMNEKSVTSWLKGWDL